MLRRTVTISLSTLLLLAASGCGGSDDIDLVNVPGSCDPGSTRECVCLDSGLQGTQTCAEDGKSYTACSCEEPDAGHPEAGPEAGGADASKDGGADGPKPEAAAPLSVLDTLPTNGAIRVERDTTIVVKLSSPIDPDTVDSKTFSISGGNTPPKGRVFVDEDELRFVPTMLSPNTKYTVTVGAQVAGWSGNKLGTNYSFSFETSSRLRGGAELPATERLEFFPRRFFRVDRKVELLLVGWDYAAQNKNICMFDPVVDTLAFPAKDGKYFDISTTDADNSFVTKEQKIARAGSLDKDFREDVALLTYSDSQGKAILHTLLTRDSGWHVEHPPVTIQLQGGGPYFYDLKLGDADGDGYDEIAVMGLSAGSGRVKVWLLDDAENGYKLLQTLETGQANHVDRAAVAFGNFDADAAKEFAVVTTVSGKFQALVQLFDDATTSFAKQFETTVSLPPMPASNSIHSLLADSGQLDHDSTDELVIAQEAFHSTASSLLLRQTIASVGIEWDKKRGIIHPGPLVDRTLMNSGSQSWPKHYWQFPTQLQVADMTREPGDEIFLSGVVYSNLASAKPLEYQVLSSGGCISNSVGDVDGDGYADVISIGKIDPNGARNKLFFSSFQEVKHFDPNNGSQLPSTYEWKVQPSSIGGGTWMDAWGVLVALDADQDGTVLEQTLSNKGEPVAGKTYELRLDPHIVPIVSLSAPPCESSYGQETGTCVTELGSKDDEGKVTSGTEVELVARNIVGCPKGVQAAHASYPAMHSVFDSVASRLNHAFQDGPSDMDSLLKRKQKLRVAADGTSHRAVFAVVPYERYFYRVVSVDKSMKGAEEAIGRQVSIDVPLVPRLMSMSWRYYRLLLGDSALRDDVTRSLQGSAGNVQSYPSKKEALQVHDGETFATAISGPQAVAQGGTVTSSSLQFRADVLHQDQLVLSGNAAIRKCVDRTCITFDSDARFRPLVDTTFAKGTVIVSKVAGMSSSAYKDHKFDYGFFGVIHETALRDHFFAPTLVVDYYVQP